MTVTIDGDWPQLPSSLLLSSPKAGTAAARLSLHYSPSQACGCLGWPQPTSQALLRSSKPNNTSGQRPTQRLYNLQTEQTALAGTRAPPKHSHSTSPYTIACPLLPGPSLTVSWPEGQPHPTTCLQQSQPNYNKRGHATHRGTSLKHLALVNRGNCTPGPHKTPSR